MTRLYRWWASIKAGSPQAKQRELAFVESEMRSAARDLDRLALRRDALVVEMRGTGR
jgi:hypothetical protein